MSEQEGVEHTTLGGSIVQPESRGGENASPKSQQSACESASVQ